MFKCTECGCEYEIKPDFCDCGNDEFTCVQPAKPEQKPKPAGKIETYEPIFETKTEKPQVKTAGKSVDIPSLCIFILCIILSFIVIFFAWNVEEEKTIKETAQTETAKNIPNINKLWDDTPIKVEQPKIEEPKVQEPVKKTVIQQKPANTQIKTVQKQKTVKTQLQKTTTKTTQTNTKQQTKQQTVKKTEPVKAQTQQKQQIQQTAPAKQEATAAKQTTVQPVKNPEPTVQKQPSAQAKQELVSYKASLRNTIGRKIDFTRVIGDGECTVSFKINSAGKLINRSFSRQSSNITLNDAVYNAVMATPSYNPPPEAYNNETLNLNIKFYNGNFEITLN